MAFFTPSRRAARKDRPRAQSQPAQPFLASMCPCKVAAQWDWWLRQWEKPPLHNGERQSRQSAEGKEGEWETTPSPPWSIMGGVGPSQKFSHQSMPPCPALLPRSVYIFFYSWNKERGETRTMMAVFINDLLLCECCFWEGFPALMP